MCGILAVVAKSGPVDAAACRRALAGLRWRGPDFAYSRVWDGRAFLGQTVLSITGSPRGTAGEHQRSRSGRFDVLYNGEVYNFQELQSRFLDAEPAAAGRVGTDTEVLVNLHERLRPEEIPPLLEGMYAYVVFDEAARQLHLVRDVQGEKSLYIYDDDAWTIVSSELRAIHQLVPTLSIHPQALRDYFRTRHLMLFERTVYPQVRQLQPGALETLELDTGRWTRRRVQRLRDWINPARLADNAGRSSEQLADELDALLTRCVRQMLPVDRHYAVVVSGGIDSSLLAHYLAAHGRPDLLVAVHHVGKDRISADLSGFAQALGQPIEAVRVDASTYAAELVRCQQVCGAPLHSHAFVGQAIQSARVRASGCRVLFGGDGADELFGGYDAYLTAGPPQRYSPSPYTAHHEPRVRFEEDDPRRLQADLAAAWADALDAYAFVDEPAQRVALAMMYCDAAYQLPEVGLRGADLMSMAWSVEARSVYLRRPIVEFALNLPARVKVDREGRQPLLRTKTLLKQLFLRHFPAALLVEKQGFAGFPNESAAYLGDPEDYLAVGLLGVRLPSLRAAWEDRATAWKLINTEYFVRYSGMARVDVDASVAIR